MTVIGDIYGILWWLEEETQIWTWKEALQDRLLQVISVFSVSEMYDLCTVKDKIGVIGIHTPTMDLIGRSWKGMLDNHKYVKLISCDVRIACASHLPLDPLSVGTDSVNQISPQDLMNPILYRACTNDSWNTIMNKVYATGGIVRNTSRIFMSPFTASTDIQEGAYYALLASDEWRKAMPQAGLEMRDLKPFVYQVVNTYGNEGDEAATSTSSSTLDNVMISNNATGSPIAASQGNRPITFRGHAMPYPAVPCTVPGSYAAPEGSVYPILSDGYIPKSYVACILMPPSKTQIMYYRLLVTWKIAFIKPIPLFEKYILTDLPAVGQQTYARYYSFTQASKDDIDGEIQEGHTLDTVDAPLSLVLQK